MKKIYLFIVFSFIVNYANAQLTDVVSTYGSPTALLKSGTDFYVAHSYPNASRISKFDITDTNPTLIHLMFSTSGDDFFLEPSDIALHGNNMYIADFSSSNIYKLNITDTNPVLTSVSNPSQPKAFLLNGDILYISSGGSISKMNLANANPTRTTVINGLSSPSDMILNGNIMYFIQDNASKISKIDITDTNPTPIDVVTGLQYPAGLFLKGNNIYFCQLYDPNILYGSAVYSIDITDTNPIPITVVDGLRYAVDILIDGSDMYIAEYDGNKVSKYTDSSLSIVENTVSSVSIFPNPSSDIIKVQGLSSSEEYTIYTVLGNVIQKGVVSNDTNIDIRNLASGVYFLKFKNKSVKKFIKK